MIIRNVLNQLLAFGFEIPVSCYPWKENMLIIGATFAAFSYYSPILINLTGFYAKTVPIPNMNSMSLQLNFPNNHPLYTEIGRSKTKARVLRLVTNFVFVIGFHLHFTSSSFPNTMVACCTNELISFFIILKVVIFSCTINKWVKGYGCCD